MENVYYPSSSVNSAYDTEVILNEMLIPNGVTQNTAINYELTGYINDINTEYTQTLMEFGANGNTTNIYEYGAQRNSATINGTKGYYLYDGRGSVAGLTGSNSGSMITYRYDAYGNTTKSNNTLNNPYQYNAEYTDSSTGLQYLRARYYDSSQGRFTTKDTYLGTIPNPLSRNLYTYVENNPLNYIDPSGHSKSPFLPTPAERQMQKNIQSSIRNTNHVQVVQAGGPKQYAAQQAANVIGDSVYGPSYSKPTAPYRYDPVKNPFGEGKNTSKRKETQTALQKHIAEVQAENYKRYCENGADRAKDDGSTFSLGPKEYAALALGSIMVAKVGLDDFTSGVISSVADNALYPILFLSGKLSGTEIGSFSEFSNYTFDEAFYVGRIAGDVIGVVVGAAEAIVGITNFITGLDAVVTGMPVLASGVASGEGVIVVAAGAVVAVAGVAEVAVGFATTQHSFGNLYNDIGNYSSSKIKNETVAEFEKRISKLSPQERVAAVREKANDVLKENGITKDYQASKINNRAIYKDSNTGEYYSIDTQHGRLEHFNKKGKHLGEVDFDFKQTKPADKSGRHDIIVN